MRTPICLTPIPPFATMRRGNGGAGEDAHVSLAAGHRPNAIYEDPEYVRLTAHSIHRGQEPEGLLRVIRVALAIPNPSLLSPQQRRYSGHHRTAPVGQNRTL
jgi:hypothetical protein